MIMSKTKMTGADYMLMLLYLNQQKPILGAIRLTKMMFLFEKEIAPILKKTGVEVENLPGFIAYNFGPFSKDVYEQVELFKGIKFIQVTNIRADEEMAEVDDLEELPFTDELNNRGYELNADGKYYKYQILNTGISFVESELLPNLTSEQIEVLEKFKSKINTLSPKQILKYVYTKYPEYAEKSLIKKEVLDDD